MANTLQLKRSSVLGRVPDSANVDIGEPVVNLADRVLYTKNGSGDIIQIAAGNLQGLADVSNATPNVNDVISWTGTQWAPAIVTGGGGGGGTTYANVLVGDLQSKEFTANGTGSTFDLNFIPGDANSVIVFVDSVLQAPITNYSISGDIITFTAPPENNAVVSVRYFDSSNVYQTKYFVGTTISDTFTANGTGTTFTISEFLPQAKDASVFVNGVIQEPVVNYSISGQTLTFTTPPDANAKIFVRGFSANTVQITTANVIESGNLYFTNARAREAISVTGAGSYDSSTGVITITGGVTSVGGATGAVSNVQLASAITSSGLLTTANVTELNNLYFTNARVYANVTQLNYATTSYVDQAVANVIDSAPGVLDTLNEIAAAINDDPNFFSNAASLSSAAFNQANAAYDRANVAVTYATSAFDSSNTKVATVAGVTSNIISNVELAQGVSQTGILTTANVSEVTNLYFTNTRVYANVSEIGYATIAQVAVKANVTDLNTSNVTEGTNFYFTNARVYANVSEIGYATIAQVALKANVVDLTTANVAESGNLYYTVSRANTAIDNRVTKTFVENLNINVPNTNITGNIISSQMEPTGVVPAVYGGASKVPVLTIDHQGRITSAANVNVAGVTNFTATGNSFTISTADGNSFTANIQPDSVQLGTDTTGAYVSNLVAGTGVIITGLGNEGTTPTISIGQAVGTDNNVIFANVTITGNLNVQGNAVLFESNTLTINDPLIQVGVNNNTSDALDLGFFGHYYGGSPATERHAGLFRDATDGQFKLFTNLDPTPTTIVDTANASYQSANLVVNFVVGKVTDISNHSTTDLSEGSNLYFTNARTYANVTQIGYATIAQVAAKANVVDLTTANVSELTNLYFTNARVYSNVITLGYATNSNVALKANVADLTTANVAEVTNLYFTNARTFGNITLANISALNDVSANVPVAGQALVWDANVNLWAPGNVAAEATTGTVLYSRYEFTAANNQTVFTGADDNTNILKINSGTAEVFVNGIRLVPTADYTANSTHLTLTEGTDLNDAVSVVNFVDATADFAADNFTGDGSTTTFTMSRVPSNEAAILVSFDGVKQFASEYTVSQTSLIFDSAPDPGANIEVIFMGASQSSTANGGWVEINSNTVATVGTKYMANTVGGTFTITLPTTPAFGDSVIVLDATNSFDTSNVLVSRNGNKIMGQNDDLYLDVEGSYTEIVYYNSTYGWRVIS